ncbi:MAG TPA: recombinase family protein, partial [Urbifossiella sp.]|nr:recombinase family protein [Urbifossiella sp.]
MTAKSAPAIAYSYLRFSSPEQAKGDSLRRQTELRDDWLAKSGAVLDTSLSLRDEGVSAFRGGHRENADRNALAAFLDLVRAKRIARGSYLIVESLDRLTREDIRPALTLLLNLIESGIRVVQLLPVEAVYDEAVEPMILMQAIMELSRGHSESRMKSERLGRAWKEKKEAARSGKPLTRALPAWIEVRDGKLVLKRKATASVQRVYALARAGHGQGAITRKLNTEGVEPIGRADYWAQSYVAKLLASRATMGEFQPHRGHVGPNRKPDGKPIPDYFPAAVTEDEWHAARAAIAGRRQKGGRIGKRVALFSGLLRDARDGGPLHQVHKGRKSPGPHLVSYRAAQGLPGTQYVSFPLNAFEAAILRELREIDPRQVVLSDEGDAGDLIASLTGHQVEIENKITKLNAAMLKGGEFDAGLEILRSLDSDLKVVKADLAVALQQAASPIEAAWGRVKTLADVLKKCCKVDETRTQLRAAIRAGVESMWCLFVGGRPERLAAVQVFFRNGKHRDYVIVARPQRGQVLPFG